MQQGALYVHSISDASHSGQEPGTRLLEAWEMYRGTEALSVGTGGISVRDPFLCQSSHSSGTFVSIISVPAATAHRTLVSCDSFTCFRSESEESRNSTGSQTCSGDSSCLPRPCVPCPGRPWFPAPGCFRPQKAVILPISALSC